MAKRKSGVRIPTPKEILNIRTGLGYTQAEAGARIGITQRAWARYEAGDRTPSESHAILIQLLAEKKL